MPLKSEDPLTKSLEKKIGTPEKKLWKRIGTPIITKTMACFALSYAALLLRFWEDRVNAREASSN